MCFWNCRVTVFRPSPLQWICREWVWKLGSNKATACSEEGKTYRIRQPKGPRKKGTLARGLESLTPLASQGPLSFYLGSFSFFHPPSLWDLSCDISSSSIHLLPTLVGHLYPYSSACPIGHFFWRSVSCCGPHRAVQGSHLPQRG